MSGARDPLGDGVKNKLNVIATEEETTEPTLMLRGSDPLAARAARAYADAIEGSGGDTNLARIIRDHAKRMSQYSATKTTVTYKSVQSLEEPMVPTYNPSKPKSGPMYTDGNTSVPPTVRGPYDASKRRNPRRGRI